MTPDWRLDAVMDLALRLVMLPVLGLALWAYGRMLWRLGWETWHRQEREREMLEGLRRIGL